MNAHTPRPEIGHSAHKASVAVLFKDSPTRLQDDHYDRAKALAEEQHAAYRHARKIENVLRLKGDHQGADLCLLQQLEAEQRQGYANPPR